VHLRLDIARQTRLSVIASSLGATLLGESLLVTPFLGASIFGASLRLSFLGPSIFCPAFLGPALFGALLVNPALLGCRGFFGFRFDFVVVRFAAGGQNRASQSHRTSPIP
jgi:hypothetical protein